MITISSKVTPIVPAATTRSFKAKPVALTSGATRSSSVALILDTPSPLGMITAMQLTCDWKGGWLLRNICACANSMGSETTLIFRSYQCHYPVHYLKHALPEAENGHSRSGSERLSLSSVSLQQIYSLTHDDGYLYLSPPVSNWLAIAFSYVCQQWYEGIILWPREGDFI